MSSDPFFAFDPISAVRFLSGFELDSDTNGIFQGAEMYMFLLGIARSAPHSIVAHVLNGLNRQIRLEQRKE